MQILRTLCSGRRPIPLRAIVHDHSERIGLRRRHELERVAVSMMERAAAREQRGLDRIAPAKVHPAVLVDGPPLRPPRLRIDVYALVGLPGAGEPAERSEIGEAVRENVPGLGQDVGGDWGAWTGLALRRGAAIAQGRAEATEMEPECGSRVSSP